jgi:hypothetical protein
VQGGLYASEKTCAGAYRYGFNTQEKDDEVYGAGNLNTALFWEYDTRIGRRWNIDPVKKMFQSNYSVFSCNPIWKIDPNGDDDYYNNAGKYLGSIGEGTEIRLLNKNTVMSKKSFEELKGIMNKDAIDAQMFRKVTVENESSTAASDLFEDYGSKGSNEQSAFIVLNIDKATLSMELCPPTKDDNNEASIVNVQRTDLNSIKKGFEDYCNIKGNTDKIVVGQLHTHPEQKKGYIKPGVSEIKDKAKESDQYLAILFGIPVFAVDKNNVHMVNQKGEITNFLDKKTDVLKKALEVNGGKK